MQLMLRVGEDDSSAFALLMARYERRVLRRFYWLVDNYEDAEDLTQEAFLNIYLARKRYRPTALFSTWLFTVVNNLARSALRKRRRAARLVQFNAQSESTEAVDEQIAEPLVAALRQELREQVMITLQELSARQREALTEYAINHRTYVEVAGRLCVSLSATKSLLHRARRTLRARLGEGFVSST